MKYSGLIFVFCLLLACGQPSTRQNKPEGKEFYYYPGKNLYYDPARQQYIYSLDSGRTWDSIRSTQPSAAIDGKRETIYSSTDQVWLNNANHIDEYHGIVLNVVNEQSLKTPESETSTHLALKKTQEKPGDADKKERKRPIKRFFQKLFGKKKDG